MKKLIHQYYLVIPRPTRTFYADGTYNVIYTKDNFLPSIEKKQDCKIGGKKVYLGKECYKVKLPDENIVKHYILGAFEPHARINKHFLSAYKLVFWRDAIKPFKLVDIDDSIAIARAIQILSIQHRKIKTPR